METAFLTSPLVWRRRLLEDGLVHPGRASALPHVGEDMLLLREKLREPLGPRAPKPRPRKRTRGKDLPSGGLVRV